MGKYCNWSPLKLFVIDADTGKALGSDIMSKKYMRYQDKHGRIRLLKTSGPLKLIEDDKPEDKVAEKSTEGAKKAEKPADGAKKADDAAMIDTTKIKREKWTTEQDQMLSRLKKLNNSWKDIAVACQCSIESCKNRWKEIDPDKGQQAGATEQQNKPEKKQSEKKQDKKAEFSAGDKQKAEDVKLQPDQVFTAEDLDVLRIALAKDRSLSALRLASALFDKTGRRIHQDDIAEKFAQLLK